MIQLVFCTRNSHKTKELKKALGDQVVLSDLNEIGFSGDIVEDGKTFIENSIIKCEAVYKKTGLPVIADDSGLSVASLGGRPGIHSARYGGDGLTDKDRYELLLGELKDSDERDASFVCALTLYMNPNNIYVVQEEISGYITETPAGTNGFGYDPIFFVPMFGRTMAQLTGDEKNSISHRGKAAAKLSLIIKELVSGGTSK